MGRRYKASEVTRQAICGALKQLMAQKPLERITVAEIMESCGMRRAALLLLLYGYLRSAPLSL